MFFTFYNFDNPYNESVFAPPSWSLGGPGPRSAPVYCEKKPHSPRTQPQYTGLANE